jgi:hypothetical protein
MAEGDGDVGGVVRNMNDSHKMKVSEDISDIYLFKSPQAYAT